MNPATEPETFADEGVCAFCGNDCETAELMLEIHQAVEHLVSLNPGDAGFDAALDNVRNYVGA